MNIRRLIRFDMGKLLAATVSFCPALVWAACSSFIG